MTKLARFMLLCAFLAAAVIPPISSPAEECGTQGAFALAQAQLMGIEAADQESAIRALDGYCYYSKYDACYSDDKTRSS